MRPTAVCGRLGHYTLEEVAHFCQVIIRGRHTAYGDATATATIFKSLATRLSRAEQPVSHLIQCQTAMGHFMGQ